MVTEFLEKTQNEYYDKLKDNSFESLSCFVEYMTPDEPPATHHDWLCDRLEDVERHEIMRLMVSMPPGHAKTKFCSRYFPAWYLGRHPRDRWLHGGHSQTFVENEMGKYVRDIVNTEQFREVFPEVFMSMSTKSKGDWKLSNGRGGYVCKGVGQGISGYRGNAGMVDDPFSSREDAESPTIRQKVYDWFNADFTTRFLPHSPIGIVATRWNLDDLCGRMEDDNKAGKGIPWYIINLPAVIEDERDVPLCPLGRKMGDPLWPDYYDLDHLMNLKSTLPPRDWNSLYQGKPVNEDGEVMKDKWITRYDKFPRNDKASDGTILEYNVRRTMISVDCANKDNERADFTAISVWVEDFERQHFLIRMVRKRVEFPALVNLIESTAREYSADGILVEDAGSGTQYIQSRRAYAPCPIIECPTGNKAKGFRFDAVIPMFQGGQVLFPKTAPWLAELEREMLEFPNGDYDDQVDSISQYLAHVRRTVQRGTVKMHGMSHR